MKNKIDARRDMEFDSENAEVFNKVGELVLELKNTGNGYIAYFPGQGTTTQDNFLCMDYSEASYLFAAMKKFKKELK